MIEKKRIFWKNISLLNSQVFTLLPNKPNSTLFMKNLFIFKLSLVKSRFLLQQSQRILLGLVKKNVNFVTLQNQSKLFSCTSLPMWISVSYFSLQDKFEILKKTKRNKTYFRCIFFFILSKRNWKIRHKDIWIQNSDLWVKTQQCSNTLLEQCINKVYDLCYGLQSDSPNISGVFQWFSRESDCFLFSFFLP